MLSAFASLQAISILQGGLKLTLGCITSYYCYHFGKGLLQKQDPMNWQTIGLVNKEGESPKLVNKSKSDTGYSYCYLLPSGISESDVLSKKDKLEYALQSKLEIKFENYRLILNTISSKYESVYKIDLATEMVPGMKLNIGRKLDNKNMILDLTSSECHSLVCSESGGGKSTVLNIIVSQLILKDIDLYIVDPKKVEYTLYTDYPNLHCISVTHNEIEQTLGNLVQIMYSRYETLSKAKCKNYKDYNKKNKYNQMKPIVLLIDEFSVIKPKSKSYPYESYNHLFDLLARARACNILIILCTQRPDSKTIGGELRCNIQNTIVFKVSQQVDSEVALSERGNYSAFKIKEVGVGLLKTKGTITEFKGFYLTDDEILQQIGHKLTGNTHLVKHENKPIATSNKLSKEDIESVSSAALPKETKSENTRMIDILSNTEIDLDL